VDVRDGDGRALQNGEQNSRLARAPVAACASREVLKVGVCAGGSGAGDTHEGRSTSTTSSRLLPDIESSVAAAAAGHTSIPISVAVAEEEQEQEKEEEEEEVET